MKIIVFSDSHGYTSNMSNVLYNTSPKDCDLIIHLGDYVKDAEKIKKEHPNYNICIIPGNNDFTFRENQEKTFNFESRQVLACHGHRYGVKTGLSRLFIVAKQRKIDIVLFGHTHMPFNEEKDGILFLNPGSITEYRTYLKLTVDKEYIDAEIRRI